jgi:hypothetical protein
VYLSVKAITFVNSNETLEKLKLLKQHRVRFTEKIRHSGSQLEFANSRFQCIST